MRRSSSTRVALGAFASAQKARYGDGREETDDGHEHQSDCSADQTDQQATVVLRRSRRWRRCAGERWERGRHGRDETGELRDRGFVDGGSVFFFLGSAEVQSSKFQESGALNEGLS
jgi:hypothetical protein